MERGFPCVFESIRGQRVLITGATGGIGTALVTLFAKHGARIGIHYHRNHVKAQGLQRTLGQQGMESRCFRADLTQVNQIRDLVRKFVAHFRGVDVLINNAGGVFEPRTLDRLREQAWDKTFALNTKAPFFLSQAVLPYMRRQGGGKIINISSVAAKYGGSEIRLHYGAAKAALEALTIGLARRMASNGIRVTAIRAGFIETPFHKGMRRSDRSSRIQKIPLLRSGKPEDVAQMALFLASKAGDFITAETVEVSGGD